MDNENNSGLDEELSIENEEQYPNEEDYEDGLSYEDDGEFEFDDDGNIVIPDGESSNENGEVWTKEPSVSENKAELDERDAEIARLRQKHEELNSLAEDTLEMLGVESDNAAEGLAKLAAEAADLTPEEYLKQREESANAKAAKQLLQEKLFSEKAAKDLAQIHEAFPETNAYDDIRKLPNIKKIGEFIDKGLTAAEAYAAANTKLILEGAAVAARRRALNDGKNHLKSNVPKGSRDTSVRMTRGELQAYRDMFPDMTDKQITELYGKATRN